MATAIAPSNVFRAVSDPNRRALLDLLQAGERTVNELVARFRVSQPAISQHLRILRDAGLVRVRKAGRRRFYRVEGEPLRSIADWVAHYERFWNDKMRSLGAFLDAEGEGNE